ncbi:MAG: hypothetical protein R3F55_01895 [Alphaproteobacteria bacterium]
MPTDRTQHGIELGEEALRAARIAAHQAGMPVAQWIAVAILSAAAEQAGLVAAADDGVAAAVARMEAKLDRALGQGYDRGGPAHAT